MHVYLYTDQVNTCKTLDLLPDICKQAMHDNNTDIDSHQSNKVHSSILYMKKVKTGEAAQKQWVRDIFWKCVENITPYI